MITGVELRRGIDSLLAPAEATQPGTLRRVRTFGLDDAGSPHWSDPATLAGLKQRIRAALGL